MSLVDPVARRAYFRDYHIRQRDTNKCPSCHMRELVPPKPGEWTGIVPEIKYQTRQVLLQGAALFDQISEEEGESFTASDFVDWLLADVGVRR